MYRFAVTIAVIMVALCSSASGQIIYATQFNNGSKLLLKEGTDSLFYVYNDNGDVRGKLSEDGEDWSQFVLIEDHDNPAIAADSTDERWIVARKPQTQFNYDRQDLYYFSGGSWQSQTLYSADANKTLGPASLAGASSTTTGIVYAAFTLTAGNTGRIILTKFKIGDWVKVCTLATVAGGLGDPAIAVEPYTADSDYIHVVWENFNDLQIDYATGADGRGNISQYILTSNLPVSDSLAQSQHPSINAERGRAVVAWEQREDGISCYDVFARQRSAGNWLAMQNLSNSASYDCRYPSVAMGDTVVVAWGVQTDEDRYGICHCIDFGTVITVVDTPDFADFPHVVFQNKFLGDEYIPYVHMLWSREYYHACYTKTNLKDLGHEGQQSTASASITGKPTLGACEPNPIRGHTRISYALPVAGKVALGVYDATGRPVRLLASGHQKAGDYSVNWDARDGYGKQVPCGVYFYRLDTPGFRAVQKAIVTR